MRMTKTDVEEADGREHEESKVEIEKAGDQTR